MPKGVTPGVFKKDALVGVDEADPKLSHRLTFGLGVPVSAVVLDVGVSEPQREGV
jgi:hypothetical protein